MSEEKQIWFDRAGEALNECKWFIVAQHGIVFWNRLQSVYMFEQVELLYIEIKSIRYKLPKYLFNDFDNPPGWKNFNQLLNEYDEILCSSGRQA